MTHQFLLHLHWRTGLVQPRAVRVAERMPPDSRELPGSILSLLVNQ
jgi:hypothetical protein